MVEGLNPAYDSRRMAARLFKTRIGKRGGGQSTHRHRQQILRSRHAVVANMQIDFMRIAQNSKGEKARYVELDVTGLQAQRHECSVDPFYTRVKIIPKILDKDFTGCNHAFLFGVSCRAL